MEELVQLALDENFPVPILECIQAYLVGLRLMPVQRIDPHLRGLSDRELILALHLLGWTGLVTNDKRMLSNPATLAALIHTKLTLFAVEGLGHDPVRATGAILLDLQGALKRRRASEAGVFRLRAREPSLEQTWRHLETVAQRQHRTAGDLLEAVRVTEAELTATSARF